MDYVKTFDKLTQNQKIKIMESYKTYRRIKNDEKINIEVLKDAKGYESLVLHDSSLNASLRQLNNSLFDATTSAEFFSGLYSVDLVESIKRNGFGVMGAKKASFPNDQKMTKEHAVGRNSVSMSLLNFDKIYKFTEFIEILFKKCFVNYTTVDENSRLSYFYKNNNVNHWTEAYQGAGLSLCVPTFSYGKKGKSVSSYDVLSYDDIRKNIKDNPYYYKFNFSE